MASQKQIEANRKNALKSTGATTPEGKAIVRFNAVTHGLTSEAAVIPFVENPEDWEAHRQGIIGSLSPVGHLETILTERIAMLIWRLGRANRYERELAAIEQERMEEKHFEHKEHKTLEDVQDLATDYKRLRVLITKLPEMKDSQPIRTYEAVSIFDVVANLAENTDIDELEIPGFPEDQYLDTFDDWTAKLLLDAIKAIAESEAKPFDEMLHSAQLSIISSEAKARIEFEKAAVEIDRKRRKNLLPNTDTLDKLYRYESHLERSLYKAMHEIENLQATRKGNVLATVKVTIGKP
ncbi:MAG: hypothetical protein HY231_07885 [Acidobacteria bacterium]|nr:hypothetical protein [Acidobacteriota bacterium]